VDGPLAELCKAEPCRLPQLVQIVRAVYRRYPWCALKGRLLDFSAYNPHWGSFVEHPKYILLILPYTSNYFTCICESSVIASTHIAPPLPAPCVTILCCWSSLTQMDLVDCMINSMKQCTILQVVFERQIWLGGCVM
jgi:hypothetical protein